MYISANPLGFLNISTCFNYVIIGGVTAAKIHAHKTIEGAWIYILIGVVELYEGGSDVHICEIINAFLHLVGLFVIIGLFFRNLEIHYAVFLGQLHQIDGTAIVGAGTLHLPPQARDISL